MPAWVKDEGIWSKAKKAAAKENPEDLYALTTQIYKQMGGRIGKGSKETATSQGSTQLLRPGSRRLEADSIRATSYNPEKREVEVILITEGPGNRRTKNYYSEKAIRSGVEIFEGLRSFLNHQDEIERELRPEQDVRELCGYFKDCRLVRVANEAGEMVWGIGATFCADDSEAGQEAFSKAIAAIKYAEQFPNSREVYAGFSINAVGEPSGLFDFQGEKWNLVDEFSSAKSVDVVTRPARGGRFVKLVESALEELSTNREGEGMKKKKLLRQIAEATAELKKLQKAKKDKKALEAQEAKIQDFKLQLSELVCHEAEDENEEEGEDGGDIHIHGTGDGDDGDGDGDEAEGDGEGDEAEARLATMKSMKKHVPKHADETDNEYEVRLGKAMKAAKGMSEESDRPAGRTSDRLVRELRESLRESQKQVRVFRLRAKAEKLLSESTLPQGEDCPLTVRDLVLTGSVAAMESMVLREERRFERYFGGAAPERGTARREGEGKKLGDKKFLESLGVKTRPEVTEQE